MNKGRHYTVIWGSSQNSAGFPTRLGLTDFFLLVSFWEFFCHPYALKVQVHCSFLHSMNVWTYYERKKAYNVIMDSSEDFWGRKVFFRLYILYAKWLFQSFSILLNQTYSREKFKIQSRRNGPAATKTCYTFESILGKFPRLLLVIIVWYKRVMRWISKIQQESDRFLDLFPVLIL